MGTGGHHGGTVAAGNRNGNWGIPLGSATLHLQPSDSRGLDRFPDIEYTQLCNRDATD